MPRPGAGTSGLFAVLGNAGTTLLFSQTTLQQVGTVKMNRDVAGGACFTGDGRSLVTFNCLSPRNAQGRGKREGGG